MKYIFEKNNISLLIIMNCDKEEEKERYNIDNLKIENEILRKELEKIEKDNLILIDKLKIYKTKVVHDSSTQTEEDELIVEKSYKNFLRGTSSDCLSEITDIEREDYKTTKNYFNEDYDSSSESNSSCD